jgi:hypothetical protein
VPLQPSLPPNFATYLIASKTVHEERGGLKTRSMGRMEKEKVRSVEYYNLGFIKIPE